MMKNYILNLFNMQTDLMSYTFPVLKIIVCIVLIIIGIFRKYVFHQFDSWFSATITCIFAIITIAAILCIYISVGEVCYVYSNRKHSFKTETNYAHLTKFRIDDIFEMVNKNDIIEIKIVVGDNIVKIGTSSECDNSNSRFYDKLYYIDDSNYKTLTSFKKAFANKFGIDYIYVVSIDGVIP